MHAQEGTIGHPSTDDNVTVEVTLTLRVSKSIFKEGSPFEEFASALGTDLLAILDGEFAEPLRSITDVEVGVRSRLL